MDVGAWERHCSASQRLLAGLDPWPLVGWGGVGNHIPINLSDEFGDSRAEESFVPVPCGESPPPQPTHHIVGAEDWKYLHAVTKQGGLRHH